MKGELAYHHCYPVKHTIKISQDYGMWLYYDDDYFDASYAGENEGGHHWDTYGIHGNLPVTQYTLEELLEQIDDEIEEWDDENKPIKQEVNDHV